MPSFNTSAIVQGREAIDVAVSAGFRSSVTKTGGTAALPLGAKACLMSDEAIDGYEYRNMEAMAGLRFGLEIRDAQGRRKWVGGDCKCGGMGGET